MRVLDVVDMQHSFVSKEGRLYVPNAEKIIIEFDNFFKLLPKSFFDAIFFSFDTHFEENYHLSEEAKQFPIHCIYKTHDWELAINTNLLEGKINYFYKYYKDNFDRWNNLHICNHASTKMQVLHKVMNFKDDKVIYDSLDSYIEDYSKHEVFMVGVASDYCVKDAIKGYLKRDIKVNVIANLTAGISKNIEEVVKQDFCSDKNINIISDWRSLI